MVEWCLVFFPGPRGENIRSSGECYRTRLSTNWNWKFGVDNSVEESRRIFGLYNQVCIQLPFHLRGQNELRNRHDFVELNPLYPDCCFVFAYCLPVLYPPTHILCYVCFIGFLHLTEARNSLPTNEQKQKNSHQEIWIPQNLFSTSPDQFWSFPK